MPTRFYFPRLEQTQITNVSYDAGWSTTTGATRYFLSDDKCRTNTSIAVGSRLIWTTAAQSKALDRQFISRKLKAQTISGSVSGQLMVREYGNNDNVSVIIVKMSVVSNDGSITRGVLLPLGSYSTTAEFVNNATHRNKRIAAGNSLSSVTCQNGDRIVVEIGYSNTTTATDAPEASAKWGDSNSVSDLPFNETQTSNGRGWIQISSDLLFISPNLQFIHNGISGG